MNEDLSFFFVSYGGKLVAFLGNDSIVTHFHASIVEN